MPFTLRWVNLKYYVSEKSILCPNFLSSFSVISLEALSADICSGGIMLITDHTLFTEHLRMRKRQEWVLWSALNTVF